MHGLGQELDFKHSEYSSILISRNPILAEAFWNLGSEPSDNHVITTLSGIRNGEPLLPVEPLLDWMIRIVSSLLLRPVGNRRRHLTRTPFLFSA